jgi:hypothetical protein
MAASLFILGNGRTICHYHTTYDCGNSPANDIKPGSKNEKLGIKVTSVPCKPSSAVLHTYDTLLPSPNDNLPPRSKNPHFTLKNVLAFFPKKNGLCVLHCGCKLEPALLDLFFWKTQKIESLRTEHLELLGRPMKPRDRLYLSCILDSFCVDVRCMYRVDAKGATIGFPAERREHIQQLLKSVKDHSKV